MFKNNPHDDRDKAERRQYRRIQRSFILKYYDKTAPEDKFEITQLKNISLGGMCFVATQTFAAGTVLCVELKTPYLTDTSFFEGVVQESQEKVGGLLYQIRLRFNQLSPPTELMIKKLMEVITNGKEDFTQG